MTNIDEFWKAVASTAQSVTPPSVEIAQVMSKNPFVFVLQNIEISPKHGDNIYINHLLLDNNIDLDVASLDSAQSISSMNPSPWIAQGRASANFTAKISGTQKQFLTDFYNWTKSVHQRFIINEGDYIAIQRLGNNTYLILEKVQHIVS